MDQGVAHFLSTIKDQKEPGPLSRIDIPIRCALTGFPVLMYVIDGFDFSDLKTESDLMAPSANERADFKSAI